MKRSEQRIEDTWNLTLMYKSDEEWQAAYDATLSAIPALESYSGRLAESSDSFHSALEAMRNIAMDVEKLAIYASLCHECDGSNPASQRLAGLADQLEARFYQSISYFDPEVLAMDSKLLDCYLSEERNAEYRIYISKIVRMREHTLSAEGERLLALNSEASGTAARAFHDLNNIDLDFGEVDGEKLSQASWPVFMQKEDDNIRRKAYKQLYGQYSAHRHVLSRLYAGSIDQDIFSARARGYKSSLEAALYPDNVPESVYRNLIESVHEAFPILHRYYSLRSRLLAKERLKHYDVYLPMVAGVKGVYPYDEAVRMIGEAVSVLGDEYRETLVKGLTTERWVDRYENEGKRSGAFSSGGYRSLPYILTNYREETLDSVFTLIHEGGHSMHSLYSARNNPFMHYSYTIFEAEVASTFNEELLSRHLIDTVKDEKLRRHLIASRLDAMVGTLFRQTMFAEFELLMHEEVEKGGVATLDVMRKTYRNLLEAYFGPSLDFEEESDLECLRIPHFYSAFYVYKYATGLSAAIALATRVLEGGEAERKDYLSFLKSGGSRFPIDSLCLAGVDPSSRECVRSATRRFESLLDALERE